MEEYRERNMPAAASVAEQRDVAHMGIFQMLIAGFDAEMADGKETFAQKPALQSVQEEYSIYSMGALSAGSIPDTLGFWKVSLLQIHHNIYSH